MGSFCSCEGPAVVYHRQSPPAPPRDRPQPKSSFALTATQVCQAFRTQPPPCETGLRTMGARDTLPSRQQAATALDPHTHTADDPIRGRLSPPITTVDAVSKTSDDPPDRRLRLTRLILDENAVQRIVAVESDPFSQLRSASTYDGNSSHGNPPEFEALRNTSSGLPSSKSSSSPYVTDERLS